MSLRPLPRFCPHAGNHSRVHMNAHLNEFTDPSNSKTVLIVPEKTRFATPGELPSTASGQCFANITFFSLSYSDWCVCASRPKLCPVRFTKREKNPTSERRVSHSRWARETPEAGERSRTLPLAAGRWRRPPPPSTRGAAASSLLLGPHS